MNQKKSAKFFNKAILCRKRFYFFLLGMIIISALLSEIHSSLRNDNQRKEFYETRNNIWAISMAIERYYADKKQYPNMTDDSLIYSTLTTPIEYLSPEKFNRIEKNIPKQPYPYHYYFFKNSNIWILQACGPDQDYDLSNKFLIQAAIEDEDWITARLTESYFDPTNGTKSSGDLFRTNCSGISY